MGGDSVMFGWVGAGAWGGGGIYNGENYDKEASLTRDNGLVV